MKEPDWKIGRFFKEGTGDRGEVGRIASGGKNEGVGLGVELIEDEPIDDLFTVAKDDAGDAIVVDVTFLPLWWWSGKSGRLDEAGDFRVPLQPCFNEFLPFLQRWSVALEDGPKQPNQDQEKKTSREKQHQVDFRDDGDDGKKEKKCGDDATADQAAFSKMSSAAEELLPGEVVGATCAGVIDDFTKDVVVEID